MKKTAQFIEVLGDANHLAIIHAIGKSSLFVTDINNTTGLARILVSFLLRALQEHAIVTTQRDGSLYLLPAQRTRLYDLIGELFRVAAVGNGFSQVTQFLERVR